MHMSKKCQKHVHEWGIQRIVNPHDDLGKASVQPNAILVTSALTAFQATDGWTMNGGWFQWISPKTIVVTSDGQFWPALGDVIRKNTWIMWPPALGQGDLKAMEREREREKLFSFFQ